MDVLTPLADVGEIRLDSQQTCRPVQTNHPTVNRELLWKEMMAAGERLIGALDLETELSELVTDNPDDYASIARLGTCRDSISGLGQAYVDAIARHRRAL